MLFQIWIFYIKNILVFTNIFIYFLIYLFYSSKRLWAKFATSLIFFSSFSFKFDWSIIFVIELLFNPSFNFCWFDSSFFKVNNEEFSLPLFKLEFKFFLFWFILTFESFFFKFWFFCLFIKNCSFSAFNIFKIFFNLVISITFPFNIFILSLFFSIFFCNSLCLSNIVFLFNSTLEYKLL